MKPILIGILLLCASVARCASVSWSSGPLVLPNGSTAGDGDVRGWAWVQTRMPTTSETSGLSEAVAAHCYALLVSDDEIRSMTIGDQIMRDNGNTGIYTGKSDITGSVIVEGRNISLNYVADVLWVCEYNGYEYYMGAHGIYYTTGAWPQLENANLAAGGEWIRGEAIPEPSSGMLFLLGVAIIALKRKH